VSRTRPPPSVPNQTLAVPLGATVSSSESTGSGNGLCTGWITRHWPPRISARPPLRVPTQRTGTPVVCRVSWRLYTALDGRPSSSPRLWMRPSLSQAKPPPSVPIQIPCGLSFPPAASRLVRWFEGSPSELPYRRQTFRW